MDTQNIHVEGPDAHPVKGVNLHWRADGSLKIKIPKTPMLVTQLYLTGSGATNIVLVLREE